MMKNLKAIFPVMLGVVLVLSGCSKETSTTNQAEELINKYVTYDSEDSYTDWSKDNVTYVNLNGSSSEIDGDGGIVQEGNLLEIRTTGTYVLEGTLDDGQIIVDTEDKGTVRLILNGATINSSTSAPIYVKQADKTVISLEENKENTLSDASKYVYENNETEPDAAIFSNDDLTINGSGKLTVKANYEDGIKSDDRLLITGGEIKVESADDGIVGKDLLAVKDADISIVSTGDGLKSSNTKDEGKGNVVLESGTVTIKSDGDGIQAENAFVVADGKYDITTGGGSPETIENKEDFGMGMGGPGNTNGPGNMDISSMIDSMLENVEISDDLKEEFEKIESFDELQTLLEKYPEVQSQLQSEIAGQGVPSTGDNNSPDGNTDATTDGQGEPPSEMPNGEQPDGQGEPPSGMPNGEQPAGQGEPPSGMPNGEQPDGQGEPPSGMPNGEQPDGQGQTSGMPNGEQPNGQEQPNDATNEEQSKEDNNSSQNSSQTGKDATSTTNDEEDSVSNKGIKAGKELIIAGGTVVIDSLDDAIHSDGTLNVLNGNVTVKSGDDGIHANEAVVINGGDINVEKSYEALEARNVTLKDGSVRLNATDDGVNINVEEEGGMGMPNMPTQNASEDTDSTEKDNSKSEKSSSEDDENEGYLNIEGGYLYVNAAGDGLDSNNKIKMSGGTVVVYGPTESMNGSLDYANTFELTGGTLIAAGSSGMVQGVSEDISSQNTILMTFDEFQEAGTPVYVENSDGEQVFLIEPEKEFQSILISTPELKNGETYTLSSGGSATGEATDGIYEQDSKYTKGSLSVEFSISSIMTYLDEDGVTDEAPGMMGGFGGGQRGGMGGGNPFGQNTDQSQDSSNK